MPSRTYDLAILALGVAAVSTAAVMIREANAPALVIAAYRLGFASLPLLLLASARRWPVSGHRKAVLLSILAGSFLALHFGFWIASVQQTSIVTSVALVTSQPLFVALASGPLLNEWPSRTVWLSIAVAAAGAAVMVSDDIGGAGGALKGDLFALLGAMFAAAYILCGRAVRTSGTGWQSYITVTYSVSAVLLFLAVAVSGDSISGFSSRTYVFFGLLALVPQLLGHTALNRSLGYLSAATVAIAILGEPVGATILASAFLGEHPTLLEALGGLLLLAGVYGGVRASLKPGTSAQNLASEG